MKTAPSNAGSRFTVDYWRDRLFRPKYSRGDTAHEVLEWHAQIQFGGQRRKVGLGSNNKEECARKSAQFFKNLLTDGWEKALEKLSPDRKIKPKVLTTVGDVLEALRAGTRRRTFENYAYALRKIAREAVYHRSTSKNRFNPKSNIFRRAPDLIPLAKITPEAVTAWKEKRLTAAGQDPVSQSRARRTINSYIRNARSLFSRERLESLKKKGTVLPAVLPFGGIKMEREGSTKYHSKVNAQKLYCDAKTELRKSDPESYKTILLGLGAGLRRREMDGVQWNMVDQNRNAIDLQNHEEFEVKTEDSEGVIFVDSTCMQELVSLKVHAETDYVIEGNTQHAPGRSPHYYRANQTFSRVIAWLRAHGVNANNPLHILRKEFGSIICASDGIHAASAALRHSNIGTTADIYVDNRRRATVPIGKFISATAASNTAESVSYEI